MKKLICILSLFVLSACLPPTPTVMPPTMTPTATVVSPVNTPTPQISPVETPTRAVP